MFHIYLVEKIRSQVLILKTAFPKVSRETLNKSSHCRGQRISRRRSPFSVKVTNLPKENKELWHIMRVFHKRNSRLIRDGFMKKVFREGVVSLIPNTEVLFIPGTSKHFYSFLLLISSVIAKTLIFHIYFFSEN